MRPDVFKVPGAQIGACVDGIEHRRNARQTRARKDVLLEKIATAGRLLEELIADHNCLDERRALGLEAVRARIEKRAEVLAPNRLEHLDAHQLVELAHPLKIAVVTLEKRDPVLQPRLAHALFGEAVLLIGNCGGGHAAAVLARGVDCQRAPTRADLQQVVRRAQVELAASPVNLLDLRLLERGGAVLKDSARICHRGIEKQREEFVTKVVVGDDVASAA